MSHVVIDRCSAPDPVNAILSSLQRRQFNGARYAGTIVLALEDVDRGGNWEESQIRVAGTDNDNKQNLLEDLEKGIRYDQLPPIVIFDKKENKYKLVDGFTRTWGLLKLCQKYWVFDLYEIDPTYNYQNVIEDISLGANSHAPNKSAAKEDFIKTGSDRVTRGQLAKDMNSILEWVESVPNVFSKKTRKTIATKIYKDTVSISKLRSLELEQVKEIIRSETEYQVGGKIDQKNRHGRVVNASNDLYSLRNFKYMLEDYAKTGRQTTVAFYCSSAISPEELKEQRNTAKAELEFFHTLAIRYVSKFLETGVKPFEIVGSIAQIKGEEDGKVIVPFD
jgi:hypothetical protein